MGYFDELSDLDFEELVADLFQAETSMKYRSGSRGRDEGIDVVAYSARNRKHVIQCKHARTARGADQALREAKKERLALDKRKPRWTSYRFVTSARLTIARRADVARELGSWVKSPESVYGENELRQLLRKHDKVAARHPKLWLRSSAQLQRQLNAGAYERSGALIDEIRAGVSRYVETEKFVEARRQLHQERVCVISGPPGVGKTTMARMLLLDALGDGFQPYEITLNGLRDAWSVRSDSEAQAFYYDDFLGHVSASENTESEENLLRFIKQIHRSQRARIILTTREYVLRDAQRLSEVLEREESELHKVVIKVSHYSLAERARMLYNHLYFTEAVSQDAIRALVQGGGHLRILRHRNFSPRLVEWMTGIVGSDPALVDPAAYPDYCVEVLENPRRLWKTAYANGLDDAARAAVLAIVSLPWPVSYAHAERAFVELAGAGAIHTRNSAFREALELLDDSFVSTSRGWEGEVLVRPINPSVVDFLADMVRESTADALWLAEGAAYLSQLNWLLANLAKTGADADAVVSKSVQRVIELLPASPAPTDRSTAGAELQAVGGLAEHSALAKAQLESWLTARMEVWCSWPVGEWHLIDKDDLQLTADIGRLAGFDATNAFRRVLGDPKALVQEAVDFGHPEWSPIETIHKNWPDAFAAEVWSELETAFGDYIDGIANDLTYYCDSPEEVHLLADLADEMGRPMDDYAVRDAADSLREDEAEDEPEDDSDDGYLRDARAGVDEERYVDRLFARLAP